MSDVVDTRDLDVLELSGLNRSEEEEQDSATFLSHGKRLLEASRKLVVRKLAAGTRSTSEWSALPSSKEKTRKASAWTLQSAQTNVSEETATPTDDRHQDQQGESELVTGPSTTSAPVSKTLVQTCCGTDGNGYKDEHIEKEAAAETEDMDADYRVAVKQQEDEEIARVCPSEAEQEQLEHEPKEAQTQLGHEATAADQQDAIATTFDPSSPDNAAEATAPKWEIHAVLQPFLEQQQQALKLKEERTMQGHQDSSAPSLHPPSNDSDVAQTNNSSVADLVIEKPSSIIRSNHEEVMHQLLVEYPARDWNNYILKVGDYQQNTITGERAAHALLCERYRETPIIDGRPFHIAAVWLWGPLGYVQDLPFHLKVRKYLLDLAFPKSFFATPEYASIVQKRRDDYERTRQEKLQRNLDELLMDLAAYAAENSHKRRAKKYWKNVKKCANKCGLVLSRPYCWIKKHIKKETEEEEEQDSDWSDYEADTQRH